MLILPDCSHWVTRSGLTLSFLASASGVRLARSRAQRSTLGWRVIWRRRLGVGWVMDGLGGGGFGCSLVRHTASLLVWHSIPHRYCRAMPGSGETEWLLQRPSPASRGSVGLVWAGDAAAVRGFRMCGKIRERAIGG